MCIRDSIYDIVRRTHFSQSRKLHMLEQKHRQESGIVCKHTFYPRVMNLTTIVFDDNEMKLLSKGINYNLPPVGKNKLIYEVVEAEAAIKSISDPHLQNESRVLINNKFNRAIKLNNNLPLVSRGQSRYCLLYTSRCV